MKRVTDERLAQLASGDDGMTAPDRFDEEARGWLGDSWCPETVAGLAALLRRVAAEERERCANACVDIRPTCVSEREHEAVQRCINAIIALAFKPHA